MTMGTHQLDLFHAAPPDLTHGLKVRLLGCCHHCGERLAEIGPGAGPHMAALSCARCGRHRQWLDKQTHTFITEFVAIFGTPVEPITVHIATKDF
jgi:hypothetical protein